MVRHAEFWMGLFFATSAFAVVHGLSEYQTARSVRTYVVVNGVEKDLTPDELVSDFLIDDTGRAFPFGFVASLLLCLPLSVATHGLRSFHATVAYWVAVGAGVVAGGLLSFVVWVTLGGWGPPALLPAMAAGAVLAPALTAAHQRSPDG